MDLPQIEQVTGLSRDSNLNEDSVKNPRIFKLQIFTSWGKVCQQEAWLSRALKDVSIIFCASYWFICLSAANPPFFACSVITKMSSANISPLPASVWFSLVGRGRWRVQWCLSYQASGKQLSQDRTLGSCSQQAASTSSGSFTVECGVLPLEWPPCEWPPGHPLRWLHRGFQGPAPSCRQLPAETSHEAPFCPSSEPQQCSLQRRLDLRPGQSRWGSPPWVFSFSLPR